jgi:3-hydroxy-3-methylglutaryl CoA synthase
VGYAGAASVFIDLARSLEQAASDELLLLVSYGPGGSDALTLSTGDDIDRAPAMTTENLIESKEYVSYAKHRSYRRKARGEA